MYPNRNNSAPQTHNSVSATSPTYHHPPGPPPPYSHPPPQHANSWPGVRQVDNTSPDSRGPSGDEGENIKQTIRQSLPSISEALGVDSQTSYTPSTSAPLGHPQIAHVAQSQSAAPSSPPSASRRSYGMEPSQLHTSNSNSNYQYSSFRQDSAAPQQYLPPDSAKSTYAISQDAKPPLHLQTSQPPPRTQEPATYSYQQKISPQYEQQSSQSAGSMGPPSFPYGYTPYPSRYAQTTPTSSHSAGPIYQPSTQYAAPSTQSSSWKSETASSRFVPDDHSTAPTGYSDSVKRHLDLYDLEGALSEVSCAGHVL